MHLSRRDFLNFTAAGVAIGLSGSGPGARAAMRAQIKAIAFDGFPIIDPRPVFSRAEEIFPGRGADLSNTWRTRQFEYAWLRTLANSYVDFWQVTEDALVFAAKSMKLDLSPEARRRLMHSYLELKAWPDAPSALKSLKDAGIRVVFLSNFTSKMLGAAVRNSGLEGIFEEHLSTDRVGAYKPDARAYQMGPDALGLTREEIVFVASAGWDAAGAKRFGYRSFWVNRMDLPAEELGLGPDATGANLADLVSFVKSAK